ncbi:MAG: hypothetical protein LBC34_03400, partial [Rickettsiales bacterium]|nr:hypothetical protein [Rickettsiales bacterium]
MKNIFNKTNAPYLVSGALAIGTLLASGIFAVAPYIGFLAPVAALNLGLPFIVGSAVLSTVIMGLSIVGIWQKRTADKTISEKDAQLTEKVKEIENKNSQVVLQEEIILKRTKEVNTKEKEISKLEAQLVEKNKELKDKDTVISYLGAQSVKKDAEMQEQLDKKVKYIINSDEDARRIHQEHKERNREEVLNPVAFSDLFDESPSSENHSTQNGQSWTEWCTDKAKTAAQLAMRG